MAVNEHSNDDDIPQQSEQQISSTKKGDNDFYDMKLFEHRFEPYMKDDVIFEQRRINSYNKQNDGQEMSQQIILSPKMGDNDSSNTFLSPRDLSDDISLQQNKAQTFCDLEDNVQKISAISNNKDSHPLNTGLHTNIEQSAQIHENNHVFPYNRADLKGHFHYTNSRESNQPYQDINQKNMGQEGISPDQMHDVEQQRNVSQAKFQHGLPTQADRNANQRNIQMDQYNNPNMTTREIKQREYEQGGMPSRSTGQTGQSNMNSGDVDNYRNIGHFKLDQMNRNENWRDHGPIHKGDLGQPRNGLFNDFYGYEMPLYDSQRDSYHGNTNNQHETIPQVAQNNSNFFMNSGPQEMFRPFHDPRPYQDLEQPLYVNAHQFNCIRRRKIRRDFLDSITANKNSLSYLHESRHRHAMNRLRAPSGRFLTKEEAEEMRAREKEKKNDDQ